MATGEPHVVIVGAGFGGLAAAKALRDAPVRVTVVDRTNHHLFQPLLYQVATAGLSPAEIAAPTRSIFSLQENVTVLLAEVCGFDLDARKVVLLDGELTYDFLIVAAGAETNYFGHPDWERHAPGLKTLEDAVEIRRRVLLAFERAERETNPEERARLLTFVVIGGGPTGVEMAGALSELARYVLAGDFRSIKPKEAHVVLVEAGARVLPSFSVELSASATEQLQEIEVEVRTGQRVTRIDDGGVTLGSVRIPAATVVWGAGVAANPLARALGVPLDPEGRVIVESDVSLAGRPECFVVGDMARFTENGGALPGVSPVAMQEGRAAARAIRSTIAGNARAPFRYVDKGSMATIGRSRAVAVAGRAETSGLLAWLLWLVVHIWFLVGFRSRLVVMLTWAWSYFTYRRGARLIVGPGWTPHASNARAASNDPRRDQDGATTRTSRPSSDL